MTWWSGTQAAAGGSTSPATTMKMEILKPVNSDLGFLRKGDRVEVSDHTARLYLQRGIGQKVDQDAEQRQTKIVEPEKTKVIGDDIEALIGTPERQKRKYHRRK